LSVEDTPRPSIDQDLEIGGAPVEPSALDVEDVPTTGYPLTRSIAHQPRTRVQHPAPIVPSVTRITVVQDPRSTTTKEPKETIASKVGTFLCLPPALILTMIALIAFYLFTLILYLINLALYLACAPVRWFTQAA